MATTEQVQRSVGEQLQRLADDVRAQWPGKEIIEDEHGVWWRDHSRHTDYGIYGTTMSGEVVFCLDSNGNCHLQRSIPEG